MQIKVQQSVGSLCVSVFFVFVVHPLTNGLEFCSAGAARPGSSCNELSLICMLVHGMLDFSHADPKAPSALPGTAPQWCSAYLYVQSIFSCDLLQDRIPGPAHVPMTEEQQKMDEMMAKMKASGMGGKLYDKDALKAQMEALQAQADDGDFGEVHLKEQEQPQQQGAGGTGEQLLEQAKETATSVMSKVKGLWGRLAGGGSTQPGKGEL